MLSDQLIVTFTCSPCQTIKWTVPELPFQLLHFRSTQNVPFPPQTTVILQRSHYKMCSLQNRKDLAYLLGFFLTLSLTYNTCTSRVPKLSLCFIPRPNTQPHGNILMMFHYWAIQFTAAEEFAFGKQEVFLPLHGKRGHPGACPPAAFFFFFFLDTSVRNGAQAGARMKRDDLWLGHSGCSDKRLEIFMDLEEMAPIYLFI